MSSGLEIKITEMAPAKIGATSPSFLIEWITARLSKDSLRGFKEAIERQRFAFTSNDITISGVNNYDSYFDYFPDKYYGGHPFNGISVEIYWNGTIEYLGYVRSLDDLSFNDENKTIDIHCYSWQKRLADMVLEDGFTSRGNVSVILADLWSQRSATYPPNPMFNGFRSSMVGIELSEANISVGSCRDIWWDGRTEDWWLLEVPYVEDGGKITFNISNVYTRVNRILLKSFEVDLNIRNILGIRATVSDFSTHFCRAIIGEDYIAIWFRLKSEHMWYSKVCVIKADGTGDPIIYDGDTFEYGWHRHLIKPDGTVRDFSNYVWGDFDSYYTHVEEASHDVTMNRYSLSGALLNSYVLSVPLYWYGGYIDPFQSIFTPNRGLIMWLKDSPLSNAPWNWILILGGGFTSGVGVTPDWTAFDFIARPAIGGLYPIGYTDEIGVYSYWKRGYNTFTNDVRFTRTIEVSYDSHVTFEDILNDLCQLCNGNLYCTPDGYINLYDRGTARTNHTISLAYVNKKGRGRKYKDLRMAEPKLQIKTPLTDNSDDPYDTMTVKGVLRVFYRDELQEVWVVWQDEIPLIVGKTYYLGDSITETETGYVGIIKERGLDFETGERMVEFTLERIVE